MPSPSNACTCAGRPGSPRAPRPLPPSSTRASRGARAPNGSGFSGASSEGGCQVSTNGARAPAPISKSACKMPWSMREQTGEARTRPAGPAIACSLPSIRRSHGIVLPYSDRMASSDRIATRPVIPWTIRTMSGYRPRRGMASTTRTVPSGVDSSVLEHHAPRTIASRDSSHLAPRTQFPAAVLRRSEQRRETRGRIEPRQTSPVDGTVVPDDGHGLGVTDHGVVFDAHEDRGSGMAIPTGTRRRAGVRRGG